MKKFLFGICLLCAPVLVFCQTNVPSVVWRKSYAPLMRPTGMTPGNLQFTPQNQEDSGEDWFYDHANSYDAQGNLDGFIACGYSSFPNWNIYENSSCYQIQNPPNPLLDYKCYQLEEPGWMKGNTMATMAFVKPDGGLAWYKSFGMFSVSKVIQTLDGNYVAVGLTVATQDPNTGQPLLYNPGRN